jgi:hypothetical protein
LDCDRLISGEPILDVILDFIKAEGDSVEVKLSSLAVRHGAIVLLDNLLRVGLTLILAKVVRSLTHKFNLLDPKHLLQEGVQVGGGNLSLLRGCIEKLADPCFIPLNVLTDNLHSIILCRIKVIMGGGCMDLCLGFILTTLTYIYYKDEHREHRQFDL